MKELIEINTLEEFEKNISDSQITNNTVIFKYSPYCTISFVADNVIKLWFKRMEDDTDVRILKVNVISARPLSNGIAEKYKIRHESPQLIWLNKSGEVKWQGSHHRITEEILNSNLEV